MAATRLWQPAVVAWVRGRGLVAAAVVTMGLVAGGCTSGGASPTSHTIGCPDGVSIPELVGAAGQHPLGPGTSVVRAACSGAWALVLYSGSAQVQAGLGFLRRGSHGFGLVLVDDSGCYANDAAQVGLPTDTLVKLEGALRVRVPDGSGCAPSPG